MRMLLVAISRVPLPHAPLGVPPESDGVSSDCLAQMARQVEALGQIVAEDRVPEVGWTDLLDETVAIAQDHSVMAGTAMQAVASDMSARVHDGMEQAWQGARQTLEVFLSEFEDGSRNGRVAPIDQVRQRGSAIRAIL